MKIYFGYIPGISNIDTPYFSSIGEQEDYFDGQEVETIDDAFYPPHYTNTIKVYTEEVNFNSSVNYVWFEFLNKRYYYFIESIEYVSESLIYVNIVMDVIQTYMFNIDVSNGIIERKFIDRWDDGYINRNYIRENVSDGEFKTDYVVQLNNYEEEWFYILSMTEVESDKEAACVISMPNGRKVATAVFPAMVSFINLVNEDEPAENHKRFIYDDNMVGLSSKDWVVNISLCPFTPFKGITIENITPETRLNVVFDKGFTSTSFKSDTFKWPHGSNDGTAVVLVPKIFENHSYSTSSYKSYRIETKVYDGIINIPVYENTLKGVYFDSKYITQMVDNNYQRFIFGDDYANATYPIEYISDKVLKTSYYFDFMDSSIIFNIYQGNDMNVDKFRMCVVDDSVSLPIMRNDPWQSYISQNRSRWAGAIGETALDIASKGANAAIRGARIASRQEEILSNNRNFTPVKHLLKAKYQRQFTALEQEKKANRAEGALEMGSAAIGGVIGQALRDVNVWCSPVTVKNSANMKPINTISYQIYNKHDYVIDFEQCAQFFHRNGYLVNEYINHKSNIFNYVKNRYYFNVLKMSDVDLHLVNVIEDDDTVDQIKRRLFDGLRLWDMHGHKKYNSLRLTMTSLSDVIEFNIGDIIRLEFEDTASSTVVGEIIDYEYNQGQTELQMLIYTNSDVNITEPLNYSHLVYNGITITFDYSLNALQYIPGAVIPPAIGDFTYDNVENKYL